MNQKQDINSDTANSLFDLAEKMKAHDIKIAELTFSIEELKYRAELLKNDHMQFVMEIKESNKAKFSNEDARKIALSLILKDDLKYQAIRDQLSQKERELRLAQIERSYLGNMFAASQLLLVHQSKEMFEAGGES